MPPSSSPPGNKTDLKKQRHAAVQKKYRQHKWAIPGLRYEVQSLVSKLSSLTGQPVQLLGEPIRDTPLPNFSKTKRDAFMANSLERFNRATFVWLKAQKALLLARIVQHCGGGGDENQWHGMSTVLPLIKQALGTSKDPKAKVNGWVVMAVVLGVDEVCKRLISRLDTISIVAGLLIVPTIALVATPSAAVAGFAGDSSLDAGTYKTLYVTASIVALVSHFTTVVMNSAFTATLRVAARDADRYRIFLRRDWLPTTGDIIFTAGNVALAGLIALCIYPVFGPNSAAAFAFTAISINGASMHLFNVCFLLPLAHPVHGWHKHHPDEFDLSIPLERLEALAAMDSRR